MHISFGKKSRRYHDGEPYVTEEELRKVKEILSSLPEGEVLLDMRKCEQLIVLANVCKHEGNQDGAEKLYEQALTASRKANLVNLVALAEDGLCSIQLEREEEVWIKDVLDEM